MKKIPLTQGKFALIDDKDFELVGQHNWHAVKDRKTFYACTKIREDNGKQATLRMHRLILDSSGGLDIDHRDSNGLNNRRSNLRACTHQENSRNQRPKRGSSKYKGVSWNKQRNKWQTHITINGKVRYLGRSVDEVEAAKAYDEAASELFGEFAYLNFKEI